MAALRISLRSISASGMKLEEDFIPDKDFYKHFGHCQGDLLNLSRGLEKLVQSSKKSYLGKD